MHNTQKYQSDAHCRNYVLSAHASSTRGHTHNKVQFTLTTPQKSGVLSFISACFDSHKQCYPYSTLAFFYMSKKVTEEGRESVCELLL